MTIPPLRDLVTIIGAPELRRMVRTAHAEGLETLLDYQRLALLVSAVRECQPLPGDVIEFGSYRGGSAAVIGQVLRGSGKTLHVCDSFEGLPAPTAEDNYHQTADFNDTSAGRVQAGLARLGIPAQMHVGFFSDVLPSMGDLRFAFAHIDVDLYESVMTCVEYCYPRMAAGGIIIFDDYSAPTCEGAKRAVDEFFANRPDEVMRLSAPAYGVQVHGTSPGGNLLRTLRRGAGWTIALPGLGGRILRREA